MGPQGAEFYRFLKGMETYRKVIGEEAPIVLSTYSDLFAMLKRVEQKGRCGHVRLTWGNSWPIGRSLIRLFSESTQ